MPTYEYLCANGHAHEHICRISERPDTHECPECGEQAPSAILTAPKLAVLYVPAYPGSKKHKAGYQHSHGDKKGTRAQVGYGGMVAPREEPAATSDAIWQNPLAD
jgi:putative FmdB family regulatory protein